MVSFLRSILSKDDINNLILEEDLSSSSYIEIGYRNNVMSLGYYFSSYNNLSLILFNRILEISGANKLLIDYLNTNFTRNNIDTGIAVVGSVLKFYKSTGTGNNYIVKGFDFDIKAGDMVKYKVYKPSFDRTFYHIKQYSKDMILIKENRSYPSRDLKYLKEILNELINRKLPIAATYKRDDGQEYINIRVSHVPNKLF